MRIFPQWIVVGCLAFLPSFSYAQTDEWAAVRTLPNESPLRIYKVGSRDGQVEGKLLLVEDSQLTLLTGGRPIIVPKASISRIEQSRRDSVVEGAILGALYGILAHALWAAEGNTAAGIAVTAGLGAFVDWRIARTRTVYRASQPRSAMLQIRF
jgi:hypothetical protein